MFLPTNQLLLKLPIIASALLAITSIEAETDYSKRLVIAGEAGGGIDHVAIVDSEKNLLWDYPTRAVHDLHLLENGNILFQTSWTKIVEMNLKKEIIWSYDAAESNGNKGKRVEVHAFQRLADDVTMIVESGPARILEIDKMGRILKEIKLKVDKPNTHSDTRQVHKLKNGNYLVSHEADGYVREYNSSSKVVWEFDVPLFGKEPKGGHGPDSFGDKTFASIKRRNGNYLISTGNGHSVLEVNAKKEILWKLEQHDLDGITLGWVTSLEELPNGNILIGNCHAAKANPQLIEVTNEKKVAWKFHDWDNFGNNMPCSIVVDGDRAQAILSRLQKIEGI